jgi:hypothetical protein
MHAHTIQAVSNVSQGPYLAKEDFDLMLEDVGPALNNQVDAPKRNILHLGLACVKRGLSLRMGAA